MNDSYFFIEFKYQDWLTWIKAIIYNRPTKPLLAHSEPMEKIIESYNFLINNKLDTNYFENAIIEVLNSVPKQERYAPELYTLLYTVSYVKPIEKTDYLEFLFYGGSLATIFHENINLNEVLSNILISFKNDKISQKLSSYFEEGLYRSQTKTFYGLALRNLYTNKRDGFFPYLDRFIDLCSNEKDVLSYAQIIIFILDEMCLNLKNYNEVVDWWISNKKRFQGSYQSFYQVFLKLSLKWLHNENKEIERYMDASLLRNMLVYDYYIMNNAYKPKNKDVISYITTVSSLHQPKKELLIYTTTSLATKYESFEEPVRDWFTQFTNENRKTPIWYKIKNVLSMIENTSANYVTKEFTEKLFAP